MKNTFKTWLASFLSLALVMLSLSVPAGAQEPTGAIEGTVTDPQNAIVVNASVTARNTDTNLTRTVTTSDDGRYSIRQLPPGNYEVTITGANFKKTVFKDVQVAVGQNAALDAELQIGGANEEVTIVGSSEAQIDRVDNTVSGVVGTIQIQNLPLNGRNFLDLAQLQPGVEKVEGGSFDPTKANYTGISIAGQAGRSTQIAVDGGSVVDNVVGTTVQNFSQEIVQEFQLGISNYDLSTGASSTGSVNIISKSGSNDFHGNAYIYARDDKWSAFPSLSRLDAANNIPVPARATRIPFDRQQFGGTLGGPIKRDKLFFFFNYEGNNQDGSALHNPTEAPSFAGFTPNPFDEKLLTAKIDWIVSNKTNLYTRYSFNDNFQDVPFAPGSGILPRESASGIFQSNNQLVSNRSHNVVIGTTHAFSPTVTNNFVVNVSDFSNEIDPAVEGVPEIRILGSQLFRTGTNAIAPQSTYQERHQLRDDLTWVRGNHTLRFGGNYERTSINGTFAFAKPARIRLFADESDYVTEADFLNAPVRDISMGIGSDVLPFNSDRTDTLNHRFQFYGNDSWKLSNRFTANFGLSYRIDSNLWNHDQTRPSIVAPLFGKGTAASARDTNNFAPRVGFAWDVAGNGKTVVRGGVGLYYDNTIDNLRLFERADLGPPGAELFLVGRDLRSPLFPGGDANFGAAELVEDPDNPGTLIPNPTGFLTLAQALALVGTARADIESRQFNCPSGQTSLECAGAISGPLFSTEFQVPYSIQYAVGVQRELPWKMLFQADFNYRKGLHEVIVYDINKIDDDITGPRSAYENTVPYADSSGFSTYVAGLFRLDRRFSNGFQMTASYSLSRFKAFGGDALGLGATVTDLNNFRPEFGPAGLDRTHRFVVSAIYELPFFRTSSNAFKRNVLGGWQVSMISTAFSGIPQSVFLPHFADLSRTGTFQTYLPGTRNGSIGRDITNVADLNSLITAYNASIPTLGVDCGEDSPTGRCDSTHPSYFDPITRLALLPPNTQLGGDSIISQDVRLTKTFRFSERTRLDLIGEVFNLFNVANLTYPAAIILTDEGETPDFVRNVTHGPSARTTSVFGTGGPRAFQFAAKFSF
ncbi:MAG TPA: carboxypeptidase regulatory-like domain-containing protein [Pyrinomonadaceae bacterium]|nr:carboxypeptidase regulatory-like domain-containing protein [Pyrinomonadaceae bacterium]